MAGELSTVSRGLSRLRRDKNTPNASTNSLASTPSKDMPEPAPEPVGLRGTMDLALDKVKAKARRSMDDRRNSDDSAGGSRLSAFVSRRRKSKQDDATTIADSRPISIRSGDSGDLTGLTDNRSDLSLADGSGNSSLLTDGYSDDERLNPVRPTISPRQSHLGYLTLSSPQLHAQAGPEPQSNTIDAVADSSTSNIPTLVEPSDTDSHDLDGSNHEPSPGAKLKSAFKINRKNPGGDTDSVKSEVGGAGGLSQQRSRRSSVANTQEPVETETEESSAPITATGAPAVQQASEQRSNTPSKGRGRNRVNTDPVPSTPPNLSGTPTTLVTPPTPTDPSHSFPRAPASAGKQTPTKPLSSVESIRHRRAQSAIIPSRLSASTAAPLTPTLEEAKTPGGTLTQPTSASGFFTSVFSAAQKAADQLSNSINTPAVLVQKNRAASTASLPAQEGGEEVIPGVGSKGEVEEETRQPAVETLGKGDLSFSHLGIAESQDTTPMSSVTDLPRQQDGQTSNSRANKVEEEAAARAVSVAYEKPVASTVSQAMGGRPLSIASHDRLTLTGDQTPPRAVGDLDGMKRSGSVRSRLSGRRRHRGNSATTTTTNTIATALRDSASGIAHTNASGPGHRLTGFAVASSKRNKDFHQLFRSVPDDDYLIEDYSAALQRDILLHGRLYISEGHICFSSNIFGWVTNLVISFDEVVTVEKKNTAVVFPNAIVISTLQARNTFASLVARDSTYDLLIGIWRISHPNLKSSLNGIALDKGDTSASDKTEKAESIASDDSAGSATDDEVYDEDADDASLGSFTEGDTFRSVAGSDFGDNPISRKISAQPLNGNPTPNTSATAPKGLEGSDAVVTGAAVAQDFPGPAGHAPTECGCTAEHFDKPLTDTVIPAPLGKVYSLMYGPASGAFMNKWLIDDQKSRELNYTDDKTGLDNDHKSFVFDYIKPLYNSVGPKQTKCITTNTLEQFDLERAISIKCSTQTPDVPSGNVFTTKTRYCLMWAPGNSTRMIANCTIEWTGKSWLKGPIEGGALSGQQQYVKDIIAALNAAVVTKPAVKGAPRTSKTGKRKGKREVFDAADANEKREAAVAKPQSNWGLLEPVRFLLEPIAALLKPFVSSQVVIAVLAALLVYSWMFPAMGGRGTGVGVPQGVGIYEELWRREEAQLWDWLEDRVGLGGFEGGEADARRRVQAERAMGKRVKGEGMREREVREAIRVTEEKLGVLKGAVEGGGREHGEL